MAGDDNGKEISVQMTKQATDLQELQQLEGVSAGQSDQAQAIEQHRCRVCGAQTFRPWAVFDGHAMYQCAGCDLVFFFPYPTENEMNCFYNGSYHKQRGYAGTTLAGQLRQKMYQLDIADLERTVPGKGRILDVGCAEGLLLSHLTSTGWERYGMDVSSTAIESARVLHPTITFYDTEIDALPLPDHFFDVVHLRGVFEHVLFPDALLESLKRRLKPGGTLVLSNTPNVGGLVPRLFRGRFKLVMYEHVNYYSLRTIEHLFQRHGVALTKVTYPYFGSPYAAPLKDVWSCLWNLATGAKSPPFYGNIFTVYGRSC